MISFTVTPYHTTDIQATVELLQVVLPGEGITEALFARKVLLDPNFDPSGAFVARLASGRLVGFVLALVRRRPLEDAGTDIERGWITLFAVAEPMRRCGVGSALFDAAEQWVRHQGRKAILISPYAPNYWTPGVDETAYPQALLFLKQREYDVVIRPLSMELLLGDTWCMPGAIKARIQTLERDGVGIIAFSARWITPLMDFLAREFPGDWQRYGREAIHDILLGRRSPETLWLAFAGDQILGFAQYEGDRFGPIGVSIGERGRGIGAALLFATLNSMRLQGHSRAWFFWTDDRTADRLYRPAGFHETRRFALLRKPLEGSE